LVLQANWAASAAVGTSSPMITMITMTITMTMTNIQQNSSTGCPFVDPLGIYLNTIYTGKLKLDRKVQGI
jgi:hypothetical protein